VKLMSAQDVFVLQLGELRSAETQLIDALPRMARASHDSTLADLFLRHLEETRRHRSRLDAVIRVVAIEIVVPDIDCGSLRSLVCEADEIASSGVPSEARDLALVRAAQRIEHFEIAAYSTSRSLAAQLFYGEGTRALGTTLEEERDVSDLLAMRAAEQGG
jgi:ferritin-like metal-binding protein YciE